MGLADARLAVVLCAVGTRPGRVQVVRGSSCGKSSPPEHTGAKRLVSGRSGEVVLPLAQSLSLAGICTIQDLTLNVSLSSLKDQEPVSR